MLIASISGIRGTLGQKIGNDLTMTDVRLFVESFARILKNKNGSTKIVVGRDARESGKWIKKITVNVLIENGIDVIDLDLATTPTIEMAVTKEKARGGIIISASHNPIEWNGLKFLNAKGEIVNEKEGKRVLDGYKVPKENKGSKKKGKVVTRKNPEDFHIKEILNLKLVDQKNIKKKNLVVVVDGINSVGGVVIPKLLKKLGVKKVIEINCKPTGKFAHIPEPLPQNLTMLSSAVRKYGADLGIAVDPDVDRLVFVDEIGECFGEEYTLVAIADYVLSNKKGNTVSNLSSSRALRDVTLIHGGKYFASPVGLMHVISEMKKSKAVFGGEGNGGVVYPALHYGRDALVGIALFLSHFARMNMSVSELRSAYPKYEMAKEKIELSNGKTPDKVLEKIGKLKQSGTIDRRDGIKIDFQDSWVHLRKSNTEPIIRIYTEAGTKEEAMELALEWKQKINSLL